MCKTRERRRNVNPRPCEYYTHTDSEWRSLLRRLTRQRGRYIISISIPSRTMRIFWLFPYKTRKTHCRATLQAMKVLIKDNENNRARVVACSFKKFSLFSLNEYSFPKFFFPLLNRGTIQHIPFLVSFTSSFLPRI